VFRGPPSSRRSGRRQQARPVGRGPRAALLLTFWETWPAALLAAVLFGMGYGRLRRDLAAAVSLTRPGSARAGAAR
jgi:hypothetical protein